VIKDVAIFINTSYVTAPEEHSTSFPPIRSKLILDENIYIDRLERELVQRIFIDCGPKGFSNATPQFAQLYSFIRDNAPLSPPLEWDPDERLQKCIAISRLIHPTNISFKYSARIKYDRDDIQEIIPGAVTGFGAYAWVIKENCRNWLTEEDGSEISSLMSAYHKANLPRRVHQALWFLEYAFRTELIDIRWPLTCMGFESLIHTDRYRSTKQFSKRVAKLALEVGKTDFNEQKAEEVYSMRSRLVHGQLIGNLEDDTWNLIVSLEDTLRAVLKKSILNQSFADIFSSDDLIRSKWPID